MNKTLKLITTTLSLMFLLLICSCITNNPTPEPTNVENVISMIKDLPTVSSVTLDDETQIGEARNAYDALTEEEKGEVTNLSKLTSLEEKIKVLKINNIISLLPDVDEITIINQTDIENAYELYMSLTDTQKLKITNRDKLLEAYETLQEILKNIDKIKANANVVINLINNLPSIDDVKIKNKELVNNVRIVYDKLDNNAKALVTNYQTLVSLEEKISEMEKQLELETESYPVIIAIYNLPSISNIKLENLPEVENARKLYNALSIEAKALVDNYQTLVLLEEKINELKNNLTDDEYQVTLYTNGGLLDTSYNGNYYYFTTSNITTLPIPTRHDYKFLGWYMDDTFDDGPYTISTKESTFFAKWIINAEQILSSVSDVVSSNTVDTLPTEEDDATYEWTSSNPSLYNIVDGIGKVNMAYQTHQNQTLKITVNITYKDGVKETLSKDITINPVLYTNLPSTPVATYFSTSAMYAYEEYNERYQKNKTIFSETTKETLDIIYYAFITINADGTCQIDNPTYLQEVLALKNYNVRIVGSVNGVSSTSCKYFMDLTKDETKRKKFVNNLMNLVDKNYLDGLDIDWETVSSSIKVVASSMNALVKDLREEMNLRQAENGTPYFLSCAVPASSWGTTSDRFDFVTLDKYLDYINLMSYDLNNSSITSHLSPLYSSEKDKGYGFGCVYGVNRLTSLGFSRNKIIIGCAGYGKAYKVSTTSTSQLGISGTLTKISGVPGSFDSGTIFGNGIVEIINSGDFTEYTEYNSDGKLVGSYLYSKTKGIFITYDSSEAVKEKYKYASSINGVGIMCWCYSEDTSDHVIDAIYQAKNS